MGHDYLKYAGRFVVYRDSMLNVVRCMMHRVANDPTTTVPDRFRPRLVSALDEFYYVCNGVFTNFNLDELLSSDQDVEDFLHFLDTCAVLVVGHGPVLSQAFLNDLVGDSDDWGTDVEMDFALLGIGRLANLVTGAEPCAGGGVPSSWDFDELSPRLKQERLAEHRGKR